jgi:rare lipoprotein A
MRTSVGISSNKVLFLVCSFLLVAVSCTSRQYESRPESGVAVASWYGAEFHGRPTASGERFNMYGLTCAHREYPFGTLLNVTNLSNDKSVTCMVNDRGPFVQGRDIDLSYGAAKEIGLIGPGTGNVRIAHRGREARYIKEVRYALPEGPYTVQVGSFTDKDNALHLKSGLELNYGTVYIIEAFIHDTTYYRVRLGKFQKREEAVGLARTLAEEGYSPVIMHYDERA